mmetsp:Transcript_14491/g.33464  ORF Transcript_14491/g.33464 Transcript_14491/m.33464 type:complete len:453 (-) Transcript_14491:56-1414(-)
MVVQMVEKETGATFCIANVHLPAKPGEIQSRLDVLTTVIRKIEECEPPTHMESPLDGTMVICGDFNSDSNSVAMNLLKTGRCNHGKVKDRSFKAKVSKEKAFGMRHEFRFRDVYNHRSVRKLAAPVTVCMGGREPSVKDQMVYASAYQNDEPFIDWIGGKRSRRDRSKLRSTQATTAGDSIVSSSPIRVESVFATVDPQDPHRSQVIAAGLPNVQEGFPSDHLPIGALFTPEPTYGDTTPPAFSKFHPLYDNLEDVPAAKRRKSSPNKPHSGLSFQAVRRRNEYSQSVIRKRRHNAMLRAISDWLVKRGATDLLRDVPLYKWHWTEGVGGTMKNKLRAPDLACILHNNTLVIVEVTVANKLDLVRKQKLDKYSDLQGLLQQTDKVTEAGVTVAEPMIVVVNEDGEIPKSTLRDLTRLALLSGTTNVDKATREATRMCKTLSKMVVEATYGSP